MLIADLTILRRAVPTAGRTRRSLLVIRAAKRPPPLHASGLLRQPAVGKLADANIDAISDERRWKRRGTHYGQFLAPSRGSLPTLPVAICRAPVRRGPKIVVCPLLHVWVLLHRVVDVETITSSRSPLESAESADLVLAYPLCGKSARA